MILLCGSSLISQSARSWSSISSVGPSSLHPVIDIFLYTSDKLSHFSTILIKSNVISFKTASLDFTIKYFTKYFSLSLAQEQFTLQGFSSLPPFSFLQMLICRKEIYGFVPLLSSPRLAGIIQVKDYHSCFLILCVMHRNIFPLLFPLENGLILILACQLRYLCVQQIKMGKKYLRGPV